ncbi:MULTISPECIES: EamA family transporter [unclassified Rathayibacter]|uniref:EamA family transporter n=1 Tax=unclassified Rathayibacter TaxID=2609250 RepID=UPI000F4BCCCF|nr:MULTISPECIES: EamA family transporter [unclassified Rathayibacter]ROP56969.1 O-acetylserine/cysteine efflux transporter [Rathayibacter sp. PhB186]ROS55354.1 O-acetylserine/cysteine efflux transporter [Rathayibacter sp. PhB185]
MTRRHSLLALLVVLLWGLNFVVIDVGLADVPPLLFLAMRFTVVAVPAVFLVPRPQAPLRTVATIGAFMSLGQFALLYLALALGMPAGLASLVVQAQIVLTVLIAAVLLKERPTRRQSIGLVVGVAGLVIVALSHGAVAPWLPFVVCLGGALSWAIGNVLTRRAKGASGLSLVVWSALVVPIPALLLSLLVDGGPAIADAIQGLSLAAILSTLYTAVFASLIGYGIWNSLLARYPAASVVPFTLLVPVVGVLSAWVLLGEVPSVGVLIGGAVMVAGLAVATIRRGRRDPVLAAVGGPA